MARSSSSSGGGDTADFPIPDEVTPDMLDLIERKTAAYTARRSTSKTASQFKMTLIVQAMNRVLDARRRIIQVVNDDGEDVTENAIQDVVLRSIGKNDREFGWAIDAHNQRAHMLTERDRDVALAKATVQERNNAQFLKMHEDQRTFMERVMERLENISIASAQAQIAQITHEPSNSAPSEPEGESEEGEDKELDKTKH